MVNNVHGYTLDLGHLVVSSSCGISFLLYRKASCCPPPATTPIIALHFGLSVSFYRLAIE
jgi:hypothetical protein